MRRLLVLLLLLTLPAVAAPPAPPAPSYAKRPEVRAFIRDMVQRHGFVERELAYLFSRVKREDPVLQFIRPPERPPSWQDYRDLFLTEKRIAAGVEFRATHRALLERAEREYGVGQEYVLAIIGIETFYGRNMGRYRVVDALSTLAFDYPPRAAYFRSELEQYLLLARDLGFDVFSVRGSYAGAIGIPQFMPGSQRRYAVDFDHDGSVDLRKNAADAIGSVANFLKQHGWQPGQAVMFPARPEGEAWQPYADGRFEPRAPLADLRRAGVRFDAPAALDASPGVLVELATPDKPSEYRVGLQNFYVLTRYNRSALYATAVAELAAALKKTQ
ncbi:MAG TPA: lytic murein transglycosylase B [Burkholderiales bacterium]|jgi:membrane-bound lytic murein transglycosylase B